MGVFDRNKGFRAIELGQVSEFMLGGLRVRPAELWVSAEGRERELQPRMMQVLVALARARPEVVSRDRLQELCWGGRIVGDDALNRCILGLRHLAEEFAEPPFVIHTVPRIGYRLLANEDADRGSAAERRIPVRWVALAGAVLLSLAAAGAFEWNRRTTESAELAGKAGEASPPPGTDGHVYRLYQTASGLIRTRSRVAAPTAVDLLSDAVRTDPNFAPAWARLAEATLLAGALNDSENFIASAVKAQGFARRSLAIDPNLADGHRALGGLLGFGTPEALAHLRRAAQLKPDDPENLVGLGSAHGAAGDYERELAAYRRAVELDPDYFRAVAAFALATAEIGNRSQAEAIARRGLRPGDVQFELLLGKIAWASGDFSEAVRRWARVEGSQSPRWSEPGRRFRDEGEHFLGLGDGALVTIPRPLDQRHLGRVVMLAPPSPEDWRLRNRDAMAAAVYRDENHVAAKLMLNAGRWRELVQAYDGPGGLAGIRRGMLLRTDQVSEAPVVVLALRQARRNREADRILHDANLLLAESYSRGQVPTWIEADRAALLAVQGHSGPALDSLARAMDRGWRSGGATNLADFAEEPAFRALHGNRRFERLAGLLAAHRERERQETRALT